MGLVYSMKILLVDDEPEVLNVTRAFLNHLGYEVVIADAPEQGLKLYENQSFDLVLTDYTMPNVNGFDLAKKMLEIRYTPTVLITGNGVTKEAAIEAGLVDRLSKPYSFKELKDLMEKYESNRK